MKNAQDNQATWEKAHRKMRREVRMAHKGTDPEVRRISRKRRKKLRKIARREKIALDLLTDAEAERVTSFAIYMLED